jgi:hypothetical protein
VPIIGAAAETLADWINLLRGAGFEAGPVWRHVYLARSRDARGRVETVGAAIKAEVLSDVLQARARIALHHQG